MNDELIGYREIVEKSGIDLADIFYVSSFVRLWYWSTESGKGGYIVTAQQSGVGRDYFTQSAATIEEAQKIYDTVKGVLASAREAVTR